MPDKAGRRRSGNRNRTSESVGWQDEQLARIKPGLRADHDAPQPHVTRPALKDLPADEKAKRAACSVRIAAAILGLAFTAAFLFELREFFSDFLNKLASRRLHDCSSHW